MTLPQSLFGQQALRCYHGFQLTTRIINAAKPTPFSNSQLPLAFERRSSCILDLNGVSFRGAAYLLVPQTQPDRPSFICYQSIHHARVVSIASEDQAWPTRSKGLRTRTSCLLLPESTHRRACRRQPRILLKETRDTRWVMRFYFSRPLTHFLCFTRFGNACQFRKPSQRLHGEVAFEPQLLSLVLSIPPKYVASCI